jgi:tetratricopeptide (TPR) repeat protein
MPLVARRPRISMIALGCLFGVGALCFSAYFLHEPRRSEPVEPFFDGLGTYSRKVTTTSPLAQRYLDQGLAFLYGFNYTEAARSFEAAAACDPRCAMAFWGIAIANGDAISDPSVDEPLAKAAVQALAKAGELAAGASPVERDLIEALSHRYTDPPPDDPKPLDRAYAAAMRQVWKTYPDDGDVGALTGQALMLLHRKGSWTQEGEPQPGTEEVIHTLQTVLAKHPRHPYALHLLVHVVEASPHPEMGDAAADLLRNMAPGLGHLTHMPTHIDIRRGRWQEAVVASEKSIEGDNSYRRLARDPGVYCRILMAHDNHMLAYAAAMQGESHKATQAIQDLLSALPADFIAEHTAKLDAFFAMPYELHLRFGRWDEMLAEPPPKSTFPVATAFWHFARATAFAAKKDLVSAKTEQAAFATAMQSIPAGAIFHKNSAAEVLGVGESMLAGEILYREGKVDQAIARLREAAAREDALLYVEPPEWILPARHTLGATLMDARRPAEAEAVYLEDLARRPENGWSLFGLSRSLRMQKKTAKAATVAARFQAAWQHADIKLTASCLCLPGKD